MSDGCDEGDERTSHLIYAEDNNFTWFTVIVSF